MRFRALLICAALGAGVLPFVADAATPDRHVTMSYSRGSTETTQAQGYDDRVTVTATDQLSGTVAVTLQVTMPDGSVSIAHGCNTASLPVAAAADIAVSTTSGRCDGQVALATKGTLDLDFHQKPPPPKPAPGSSHVASAANRWAVLIGIQDYQGNTHPTIGGDGDVTAIHAALLHSGWIDSHIKIIKDGQATAAGIRSATAWLVGHSSASTFSLMHYSGHVCIASRGPCASGHTYLWGDDNRFISEDQLTSMLSGLKGHAWLDVAGCESGAFDNGFHSATHLFSSSSRPNETSYEDPNRKQSIWVSLTWDQGYNEGKADKDGRTYHAPMRQQAAYGARYAPQETSNGSAGPQHPIWVGGNPSWTLAAPPGL